MIVILVPDPFTSYWSGPSQWRESVSHELICGQEDGQTSLSLPPPTLSQPHLPQTLPLLLLWTQRGVPSSVQESDQIPPSSPPPDPRQIHCGPRTAKHGNVSPYFTVLKYFHYYFISNSTKFQLKNYKLPIDFAPNRTIKKIKISSLPLQYVSFK